MKFYVETSTFGGYRLLFDGEFPKTRKAAIRVSIQKWEVIVQFHKEHPNGWLRINQVETCALCYLYYADACVNCPIYKKTGYIFCKQTPLSEFYYGNPDLKSAQKELRFLKSLLEK